MKQELAGFFEGIEFIRDSQYTGDAYWSMVHEDGTRATFFIGEYWGYLVVLNSSREEILFLQVPDGGRYGVAPRITGWKGMLLLRSIMQHILDFNRPWLKLHT